MNIATPPVSAEASHRPEHISVEEWDVRVQLAACYRLMDHFGMTDLVYNHITARVLYADGRPDHHFLINQFGPHYSEITASNLVKVDLDGVVVDGSAKGSSGSVINPAGYVIHSCIHRARPDLNAVIHTHTRAGIAISCMEEGLIPMEQNGFQFLGRIAYHDYQGLALDDAEQEGLLADMGDCDVMILRNHGLLACGANISQAFRKIFYLEKACQVQIDVMAGTQNLPPQKVQQHTADQWHSGAAGNGGIDDETLEWPAMMRLMDRKDPSYRT